MPRQKKIIPFLGHEETVTKRGVKATVRLEPVMQVTMPGGYSCRGMYHIVPSYDSVQGVDVELTEAQRRQGRALTTKLEETLSEQMQQAGWRPARSVSNNQTLLGRDGSQIWEYPSGASSITPVAKKPPAPVQKSTSTPPPLPTAPHVETADQTTQVDQQAKLITRQVKTREVTFTCNVCGETVTQQRYPSHLPLYCSDGCKKKATREKTRLRVAEWYKAHPNARRKKDITTS